MIVNGLVAKVYPKKLDVNRGDRIKLHNVKRLLAQLCLLHRTLKNRGAVQLLKRRVALILKLIHSYRSLACIEFNVLWEMVPKVVRRKGTIYSFDDCDILKFFRFKSKRQSRRPYTG